MQSQAWEQFQQALGLSIWRLSESLGNALVVERPLPWGWRWLYVPRGPVLSTLNELLTLARQQRAVFVRCDPARPPSEAVQLTAHGWVKAPREVQPAATSVIDLSQSEADLLAHMHPKTRYNLQLAERKGVVTRFSREPSALDSFVRLAQAVMARSSFRYHPEKYYRTMLKVLGPAGMLEVAEAVYNDQVLASHLLIRHGETMTYAHGASSSEHRQVMAPHLLQWHSMQRAKAQGAQWYDLYGVAPANAAPDHPWAGITRFKTGFGGQYQEYMGAYDYVLDKKIYWLYNTAHAFLSKK